MKRIEIPTKSQNVDELSNSQILIQNNSFFIDSIKTFEISDLYEKILKHEAFTKDELIYLYDIYNSRTVSDIYHYYDFEKECYKNGVTTYRTFKGDDWIIYNNDYHTNNDLIIRKLLNVINAENPFTDYAKIFDCTPEEITSDLKELYNNPDKHVVVLGTLRGEEKSVNYPRLKYVSGWINYHELTDANGLNSLLGVGDSVFLSKLETADGLNNLISIGGSAIFENLINADQLKNLRTVKGGLSIKNVSKTNGLLNLEFVGKNLSCDNLNWYNTMKKLRYIGGELCNLSKKNLSELISLEYIGGYIELDGISAMEAYTEVEHKRLTKKKL